MITILGQTRKENKNMTIEEKIEYLAKAVMTLSELGDGKTAYALNEIRLELKGLAELPEGLDDAADAFLDTLEGKEAWSYGADHYDCGDCVSAFKAGAKWRESQIPVPNDMRDAADEYSATPENKKPVNGEKYKAFVAGAEWMAGRYKFDYTKGHHTAMVLSRECMNEHGWFQREREIIQLTEFIEKLCGYNQSTK